MQKAVCVNKAPSREKPSEKLLDSVMKVIDKQSREMSEERFQAARAKVKQIAMRINASQKP